MAADKLLYEVMKPKWIERDVLDGDHLDCFHYCTIIAVAIVITIVIIIVIVSS